MIEDTYVDMERALPRDGEVSEYVKVTKRLQYANVIPIGKDNDNPMLYIRVHEVEYLYGNKASLYANTFSENLSSQVDEESNIFMLFDEIVYQSVDGTENMYQDFLIVSRNVWNIRRETTKV